MKKLLLLAMAVAIVVACQKKQEMTTDFVRVENGHFVRGGQPYYYVGTNFWYGAILGSEGQGGDRVRLGFFVAEAFTGLEGKFVNIEDTIKGFKMILDGEVDYLPEQAFLMVGTIEEAIEKGEKILAETKN